MKKVYIQIWEESQLGEGIREDGCSLHLSIDSAKNFIKSVYKDRDSKNVPNSYERISGEIFEVKVSNSLYKELLKTKSGIRIPQHSFSNLQNLGEIKFFYDDDLYI